MTNSLSLERAATLAKCATNLRAFAEAQEARAPGRMDHVTGPATAAAELAERSAAAFCADNKSHALELRRQYAEAVQRAGLTLIAG